MKSEYRFDDGFEVGFKFSRDFQEYVIIDKTEDTYTVSVLNELTNERFISTMSYDSIVYLIYSHS